MNIALVQYFLMSFQLKDAAFTLNNRDRGNLCAAILCIKEEFDISWIPDSILAPYNYRFMIETTVIQGLDLAFSSKPPKSIAKPCNITFHEFNALTLAQIQRAGRTSYLLASLEIVGSIPAVNKFFYEELCLLDIRAIIERQK